MELWETGNAEARILALLIADPKKLTRADADGLVQDGPVRFLDSYLSGLLARSPIAEETMRSTCLPVNFITGRVEFWEPSTGSPIRNSWTRSN
jgi:hypothetical protein